jgi:hypothetical protein
VNKVAAEANPPGYRNNCCEGMFTLNRFGNGLFQGRGTNTNAIYKNALQSVMER